VVFLEQAQQAVGDHAVRLIGLRRGGGRRLRRQRGVDDDGHLARRQRGRRRGGRRRGRRGRRRGVGLQIGEHVLVLVGLELLYGVLGIVAVVAVHRTLEEAPLRQPLLGDLYVGALGPVRARRGRGRGLDHQVRAA